MKSPTGFGPGFCLGYAAPWPENDRKRGKALTEKLSVIHSVPLWLPATQTWLNHQILYLPPQVESTVVAERVLEPNRFPVPRLFSPDDAPVSQRLRDKALRRLGLTRHLGELERRARACGAVVLHSHFGTQAWANARLARRLDIAHAVTFYGVDVNYYPLRFPRWRRRYRELFSLADAFLAEGPHMAARLAGLGCPPEKIHVHHLGVPVEKIDFQPRRPAPGEPVRVLMAAAFNEKKGFPLGLAALAQLKDQAAFEVTLIGDTDKTPKGNEERRRILEAIGAGNLEKRVQRLGFVDYARFLAEAKTAHVFLSPSLTASDGNTEGGAPVAIIEMAAAGLLVVSSTHADIPEVIPPGECGLLAREGDPGHLARILSWAFKNPERWEGMQKKARARVEIEFDAQTQAKRLAAVYATLARQKAAFK